MNKFKIWGIALLIVATLLAGCGSKQDSSKNPTANTKNQEETKVQKEEVTVKKDNDKLEGEIVFGGARADIVDELQKAWAEPFMDEHPGVKITLEGYKDIDQTMMTRLAANQLPDICILPQKLSREDYSKYLVPLDDLGFTEETILNYQSGLGTDGTLYAVNPGTDLPGFIYNKKAFAEAGITEVPRTRDELLDACQKLKDKGIIPIATGFKEGWTIASNYTDFMAQSLTGDPGVNNKALTEDYFREEQLYGVKLLRELHQKGYLEEDLMTASWDGLKQDVATGRAGMTLFATWLPLQLPSFGADIEDIGMFPIPDSKALGVPAAGWFYGISKKSKYPELAKEFMKYVFQSNKFADGFQCLPAWKDAKSNMKFANELKSYDIPMVQMNPDDPNLVKVKNKAAIDNGKFIQEYILAKDEAAAKALVDKYNEKWAQARKEVLGK